MSLEMPYTSHNVLAMDDGDTLPATFAPQPLTPGPGLTDCHPLLDISLTPDKSGGILRRENADRRRGRRQVRFDVGNQMEERPKSPAHNSLPPGPFEVPRIHSSIVLEHEVQREAEQEFDCQKAVHSELGRSYKARRAVESETARALNVCRMQNLYQGLVSVEPPAEQIQRLTEKERQRRAERKEVTQTEGPDLSIFSQPCDLFTETPYLSIEGLPPLSLVARPRPSHSAFDMYHKLMEWTS